MAEFKIQHHRRNSGSSDVSCVSAQSLDPPLSFKRKGNQPVGKRSRHDATLINPGPPALYLLNTEKDFFNKTGTKVRRWTYGKRDNNKQNKVILLVGETGAGKTTMINTMVNYLLGVKFEDQEFYQITKEEKHKDQTQSQTSEIIVYEVFVEENPTSLTIIDTPGYINTEGFEREREISEYLSRLFSDNIKYIDAVCFVIKASQNHLSGKENCIFQSVLSLFGKNIEDNIVFIITHSDGGPPTDALNAINTAQIRCRRDERKNPVHFLFNNQQKEKRAHAYKSSWEMGGKSMESFLKLLLENNRKSLQMTLDELKDRKQLEACVFNLMDRITEKNSKITKLNEILKAVRQNRDEIEKSKNFKFQVNKTKKEKAPIENASFYRRKATCCSVCLENCHQFGCWWANIENLSKCDVMKNGFCTVCTNKCHHSKHKKESKKYVLMTETAEMSFDELKQVYKSTDDQPETSIDKTQHKDDTRKEHVKDKKESQNKTEEIEEKLNKDLEKVKKDQSILLHEAYMIILSLSKIPVDTDWYFTPEHLDFFIPRLEEEGEYEMVKKLKSVKKHLEDQENSLSGQTWQLVKDSVVEAVAGPLLDASTFILRDCVVEGISRPLLNIIRTLRP